MQVRKRWDQRGAFSYTAAAAAVAADTAAADVTPYSSSCRRPRLYSEGGQEEDENDADDGELVPLAGLVGQKEEDEKEDLTELLDLDVVLVVDVIG